MSVPPPTASNTLIGGIVDVIGVVAGTARHDVSPGLAVEDVVAIPAVERVVAVAAVERVVAVVAVERVVADKTNNVLSNSLPVSVSPVAPALARRNSTS